MKVLLAVPWYLPESVGGTELYVSGLSAQLRELGVECVVAVPSGKPVSTTEIRDGIKLIRFAGPQLVDRAVTSIVDCVNADEFDDLLASERPDIYHQHEWSANCGIAHLRKAKEQDIRTIITFHLPKIVCRNNTMMLYGKNQCDGKVIEKRCATCTLITRGAPPLLASALASIPSAVATPFRRLPKIGRAFGGREDARKIIFGLHQVAEYADKIVTVSRWQKEALEINGVPPSKVSHIVSGFGSELISVGSKLSDKTTQKAARDNQLKIGFLGRGHVVKGLHILVKAMTKSKYRTQMSLRALVLVQEYGAEMAYLTRIRDLGQQYNLKLELEINQPRSRVAGFFQEIDILAVPSQWTENSPLVIWESRAWKVPVIGSRLGGISELVENRIDGLLIKHDKPELWAAELDNLVLEPGRIAEMRRNILPVRNMLETAKDSVALYNELLNVRSEPTLGERALDSSGGA